MIKIPTSSFEGDALEVVRASSGVGKTDPFVAVGSTLVGVGTIVGVEGTIVAASAVKEAGCVAAFFINNSCP